MLILKLRYLLERLLSSRMRRRRHKIFILQVCEWQGCFSYDGTNYYSFFISSITNPQDGQWLKYDSDSETWINFTPT